MEAIQRDTASSGRRVPFLEWNPGGGRDLVFLHGFARHPADYAPLLEELAVAHDVRILAPFLYANGNLVRPPESFWACVAITERLLTSWREQGTLGTDFALAGHSTGGTVALHLCAAALPPRSVVALNPALPVPYGTWGFAPRALATVARAVCGASASPRAGLRLLRSGPRLARHVMRRPIVCARLARSLADLELRDLPRYYTHRGAQHVPTPATVLLTEHDELFPRPPELPVAWKSAFSGIRFQIVNARRSHEWPLLFPDEAALCTAEALDAAWQGPAPRSVPRSDENDLRPASSF